MFINTIGVVGAGKMGAGIAQMISYCDLPVVIYDISAEQVEKGMEEIRSIYQSRVDKGKMGEREAEEKLSYVTPTTDIADLASVDLVIEAVPEKFSIKSKVFAELNEVCNEDAIFATNTSAISVTALGTASGRPERFVGLHFFYPANVMKLVEVIPGLLTLEDTVRAVTSFAGDIRKIAVPVKECPGFLVNRLLLPYLNACANAGVHFGFEKVDELAKEFGFPMGPFTLMDNLGLDVCYHAGKVMEEGYGPRMKTEEGIRCLVENGRIGIRAGAGFYEYDGRTETAKEIIAKNSSPSEPVYGSAEEGFDRALALMVNEAALCLQEGITDATNLDTAMLAGIGFPLASDGLLHWADSFGIDKILATLRKNAERNPLDWPSTLLVQMVDAGTIGKSSGQGFHYY
jgi:3-hydroxyacyl-CoA dehydrogenase / enoyl-CoA hydratase / 3-hydroxybutyryl-CoA epimerase